jgi:HEAT repeat protein
MIPEPADFLGELGPAGKDLVPLLAGALGRLSDSSPAPQHLLAARLLGKLGTAAVPTLRELLANPAAEVRVAAALALKHIEGKAPAGAVQAILDELREGRLGVPPESSLRAEAASALAELGADALSTLPRLRAWLEDADALLRVQSATAVWQLSKDDKAVLPVLRRGLESGDARARRRAAEALADLGPAAKSTAEALKELLEDPERDVRAAAAAALKKIER